MPSTGSRDARDLKRNSEYDGSGAQRTKDNEQF